ncbi:hypothetical protein AK830_g10722 [Neonectria ditissima]|uniref:F-box domain-containing protein n=1 Tax=Neonectria ditissima TaxID=78410 RepID=A0A0N8H5D2_9HYPO|nr:hypothetical protein AK830_g10722 [Neonectria ditissima]
MNMFKSSPLQRVLAWTKMNRAPRRTSNQTFAIQMSLLQTAPLLHLPVDLLLLIVDELPLHSQLFFSQTCHVLRLILPRLRDSGRHLPREESAQYLTVLSRNMPEHWVCDLCFKLHCVRPTDTPGRYDFPTQCPSAWKLDRAMCFTYIIQHRHVQLTLKHTRMGLTDRNRRQFLEKLLSPYHKTFSAEDWPLDVKCELQHSVYPKVVNGRYLSLSVCEFKKDKNPITSFTIGYGWVCHHQYLRSSKYESPSRLEELVKDGSKDSRHNLWRAVGTAFEMEGAEVTHSCPDCPLDFSVQASPERVTLRVWHDLGPECSPLDLAWKINTAFYAGDYKMKIVRPDELGGIRRAYELG